MIPISRDQVNLVIEVFNDQFPRPGIGPIRIDREYDLENDWPKTYPNNEESGVYLFLDDNNNLLYIGKTSMKNTFGKRFNNYFCYTKDKRCKKIDNYFFKVRKILTIPIPKGHEFESPAIEEYLITKLKPPLNNIK